MLCRCVARYAGRFRLFEAVLIYLFIIRTSHFSLLTSYFLFDIPLRLSLNLAVDAPRNFLDRATRGLLSAGVFKDALRKPGG